MIENEKLYSIFRYALTVKRYRRIFLIDLHKPIKNVRTIAFYLDSAKEEGGIKKALKVDRCELVKEIFITSNSDVITHVSSYNQGLLYHRTCKPDFLCSWPSLNSYLELREISEGVLYP